MSLSQLAEDVIRHRPLSWKQAVLTVLRRAINEGQLAPGERLDPEKIAREFGCSRMPVRDAFKDLEAEGLVTCYPSRGTEVSQLAPADIEQIFGIRLALEKLALSRAVVLLTPADHQELHNLLDTMDRTEDFRDWLSLNERFHGLINQASGWPRLVDEIERHRRNIERYLRERIRVEGRTSPQQEHRALVAACIAGNAEEACRVLEQHLTRTSSMLADQRGLLTSVEKEPMDG